MSASQMLAVEVRRRLIRVAGAVALTLVLSQAAAAQTAPPTPQKFNTLATNTQVELRWEASAGANSYNVYRGVGSAEPTLYHSGVTVTTYTDAAVTAGTQYRYAVRAVGSGGATSDPTPTTDTPVPTEPNRLVVTVGTSGYARQEGMGSDFMDVPVYVFRFPPERGTCQGAMVEAGGVGSGYHEVTQGSGIIFTHNTTISGVDPDLGTITTGGLSEYFYQQPPHHHGGLVFNITYASKSIPCFTGPGYLLFNFRVGATISPMGGNSIFTAMADTLSTGWVRVTYYYTPN